MKAKTLLIVPFILLFAFATTASAQDLYPRDNGIFNYHKAPRYRPSESHPLRTIAYVLHPLGWALREGIYRPFSAMAGSARFTRSFFGFREPYDYRTPECFSADGSIPDCRTVPPYSMIGIPDDLGLVGSLGETEPGEAMGERQVFIPDVNFEFNKHGLNDLGRGRVRQISQLLASVPSLKVVVEGHADFIGTDEYNLKLGERRAGTVMGELGELGIDPARMSPITYGESRPIFAEEEDWARAVNRRVQFTVQGNGEDVEEEG